MASTWDSTLETRDCVIKLRKNPQKRKDKVVIACGAGFGGDRPVAALKLLQRVENLDYLVLECLAERTLAERHSEMKFGGKGFDPRISEWMQLLLPLAVERGVCMITNMGAKNPHGAGEEVLQIARNLGIDLSVGLAYQSSFAETGEVARMKHIDADSSVYLGAAPIFECLERYSPHVIITSRVADASLFLGPMVFELGWNWDELHLLAQGSIAGHLLECGCQLTGGYYMHPGDKHRNMSLQDLLDISLPFAEVASDGSICLAKPENTGGILDISTCAEQLLYEIGDPSAYITPDVIVDIRDVTFQAISDSKVLCSGAKPSLESIPQNLLLLRSKDSGWKGWGEISYGGRESIQRAKAAEFLVRAWIEELYPDTSKRIISYIIGLDSLKALCTDDALQEQNNDVRLRMDGLFEKEEHAIHFTKEFTALYTNGPAGGGGISTAYKKEIFLEKELIGRECVHWQVSVARDNINHSTNENTKTPKVSERIYPQIDPRSLCVPRKTTLDPRHESKTDLSPAPTNKEIPLYEVAHGRAGDKGNDLNFSLIPHYPPDIARLKTVITANWVRKVLSPLLNPSSVMSLEDVERRDKWIDEHVRVEIYEVRGIRSLNVVVRNILDGGVNCSRRIDRHGKSISDVILCQRVVLPSFAEGDKE